YRFSFLHFLCIELLVPDSHRIERIDDHPCNYQRGKHGNDDAKSQCLRKSFDRSRSPKPEYRCCNQRRDISVNDCRMCLVKSALQRVLHILSGRDFFPHPCNDNDVCIHSHSNGQNDSGNSRKGKSDVKCVQQHQHQSGIDQKCKPCSKSRKQINSNHKKDDCRKSDCSCQKTCADCLPAKLGSLHL